MFAALNGRNQLIERCVPLCLCQPHYQRSNHVRFGNTVRGSVRGTAFAEGRVGRPWWVPELSGCSIVVLGGNAGAERYCLSRNQRIPATNTTPAHRVSSKPMSTEQEE